MKEKPKQFTIPTDFIDLHARRQAIKLRRLFRYYIDGDFSKPEIRTLGIITIRDTFDELMSLLSVRYEKAGLDFTGVEDRLKSDYDEEIEVWKNIVRDMQL